MTTEQKISDLEKQIGQLKAQLKDEQVNSVYPSNKKIKTKNYHEYHNNISATSN